MKSTSVFLIFLIGSTYCCNLKGTLPLCGTSETLLLTPYIESGKLKEGREEAEVRLEDTDIPSYAGFLTVNKTYDSNLFFWFFPAEEDPDNASVLLWLQDGPFYGLFNENGPFFIDERDRLKPREFSWAKVFNMIYIDSPVGNGFSFTSSEEGYARNVADAGRDLYTALLQFFQLFHHLRDNEFYAAGESYAGKFVTSISHIIHLNNMNSSEKINMKGVAIGNGFLDPENMMGYGEYLYQVGLIDNKTKIIFNREEDKIVKNIQLGRYLEAYEDFDDLLLKSTSSIFFNETGFTSPFNLLLQDKRPTYNFKGFVQRTLNKRRLHVGNRAIQKNDIVRKHLLSDIMRSVKPLLEVLLENYKVLFYSGQLDIISAYPLMVNSVSKLIWSGATAYRMADRGRWIVDKEVAGYCKSAKAFTEVLVRNAGHVVSADQPKWSFDMITRFVFNVNFTDSPRYRRQVTKPIKS